MNSSLYMMKVFKIIALSATALLLIIALLPFLMREEYKTEAKVELNTAPKEVWKYVNDVHNIPTRLPKIAKIKVLDSNLLAPRFKIYTHSGDWMLIKTLISSDSTKLLTIQESSFGYTGIWSYLLKDLGNESCKLYIYETGNLNHNYWLQLILILGGRKMIIEEELRSIQAMAKEGL